LKKRALIIAGVALFLALATACGLYAHWYLSPKKRPLITELTPLACDLNERDCEVTHRGRRVTIGISPRPITAMSEFALVVRGLDTCAGLRAEIYGLNMYMGTLAPQFLGIGGACEARVVLSACAIETMRYRFELFRGAHSLGIWADLDIKR